MSSLKFPDDLKFAKSDEWVRVDGDTATIGVSDYAQDQLNDIVYVEMPEVGDTVTAGQSFGLVESVKAASDVLAPVSGSVAEVNGKLEDEPELINSDPYGDGWIIKIKIGDKAALDGLMDAAAYEKFCEDR